MILKIDRDEVFRALEAYDKGISFVFDMDTYNIYPVNSEDAEQAGCPLDYPRIDDTVMLDSMKAFIEHIGDKRLKKLFSDADDEHYGKLFWDVLDNGSELLWHDYPHFLKLYTAEHIADWCEENGIAYYIDKKNF